MHRQEKLAILIDLLEFPEFEIKMNVKGYTLDPIACFSVCHSSQKVAAAATKNRYVFACINPNDNGYQTVCRLFQNGNMCMDKSIAIVKDYNHPSWSKNKSDSVLQKINKDIISIAQNLFVPYKIPAQIEQLAHEYHNFNKHFRSFKSVQTNFLYKKSLIQPNIDWSKLSNTILKQSKKINAQLNSFLF